MDIGFPASLSASSIRGSLTQFIMVDFGLTMSEFFLASGGEVMVVLLLLVDEVSASVRNTTLLAAFGLGCGTSYVGPGTAAADALLAFLFIFLAHRPQAFLLQTERKSAKPGCTVLFTSPVPPFPVPSPVDCCSSMLDCMK